MARFFKHGASTAIFVFSVLVIRAAPLGANALNKTGRPQLCIQGIAVRLHAHGHRVFCHRAVIAAVIVHPQADMAAVPKNRTANRISVGAVTGIAYFFGAAGRTGFAACHGVGYRHILTLSAKGINMQPKTGIACLQQHRSTSFLVATGPTRFGSAADAVHGCRWNAVVDQIDHTAHRTASVHDGRWPPQHLDAFNTQHIMWDRMVVAE